VGSGQEKTLRAVSSVVYYFFPKVKLARVCLGNALEDHGDHNNENDASDDGSHGDDVAMVMTIVVMMAMAIYEDLGSRHYTWYHGLHLIYEAK
jgi:hypothetical protein